MFLRTGLVLTFLTLLVLADSASAQYRLRPEPDPNRMPGWDWWRTYPWSPYNYGRNPYNPAIWPSPYPYNVYPYIQPYPQPYPGPNLAPAAEPEFGAADHPNRVLVPTVTGDIRVPPAGSAVIRMYLPDEFAQVWFDGVKTASIGKTRYYVTPHLPGDQPYQYEIRASFNQNGMQTTADRIVTVTPGRTAVVNFVQK